MTDALIKCKHGVKGRAQLGVRAFADALLAIPKMLVWNSGFNLQETLDQLKVKENLQIQVNLMVWI